MDEGVRRPAHAVRDRLEARVRHHARADHGTRGAEAPDIAAGERDSPVPAAGQDALVDRNRARDRMRGSRPPSSRLAGRTVITATVRSIRGSVARYTVPIEPRPLAPTGT
jgi:hypothetical protein